MWCTEQFEAHLSGESAVWLSKCAENILHDWQWFHPPFCSPFTCHFVFKGEAQKKYAQKTGEEKARAFHQGQADMSWQILRLTGCTFQKPVTKITSHQCGQVSLMRGDPRRSCSKSVHSGGCRTSRPTTLKENLSEPWTAQMFQGLLPWYCRWVPGSCQFQISAHQPWAHHS